MPHPTLLQHTGLLPDFDPPRDRPAWRSTARIQISDCASTAVTGVPRIHGYRPLYLPTEKACRAATRLQSAGAVRLSPPPGDVRSVVPYGTVNPSETWRLPSMRLRVWKLGDQDDTSGKAS